jgi:hypothetical protein
LQGIAALAAPHPLMVYNTGGVELNWLNPLYSSLKQQSHLKIMPGKIAEKQIAEWLRNQKL